MKEGTKEDYRVALARTQTRADASQVEVERLREALQEIDGDRVWDLAMAKLVAHEALNPKKDEKVSHSPQKMWGVVVGKPTKNNPSYQEDMKPSHFGRGAWMRGSDGDIKGPTGERLFHTRKQARAYAKECESNRYWHFHAKRFSTA